jgi:SRF-type transcription factor (DNA-binding and dimerisation domain)
VSPIPLLLLLPRLQCPELYLARTKPLCHLFKGLFFFFYPYFCAHGLGILYYRLTPPPPPPYLTYPYIQRKNGLFKKAYELGVLCSVEVAVIIFGRLLIFILNDPDSIFIIAEERSGHHVKLYQYGSADIHDIVQRHLRVSRLHLLFLLALAQVPTISTMARRILVVHKTSREVLIQS